jgi:hypothetical protein
MYKIFFKILLILMVGGTTLCSMEHKIPVVNREFFGLSASASALTYCRMLQSYAQLLHLQHDLSYIRDKSSKNDEAVMRCRSKKRELIVEHLGAALQKVEAQQQKDFILSQIKAATSDTLLILPGSRVLGHTVFYLTTPKAIGTFLMHGHRIISTGQEEPDHDLIKYLLASDDQEVRFMGMMLMNKVFVTRHDRLVATYSAKDRQLVALVRDLLERHQHGGESRDYIALIPRFFNLYEALSQLMPSICMQMRASELRPPSFAVVRKEQPVDQCPVVVCGQQAAASTCLEFNAGNILEMEYENIRCNERIVQDYRDMSGVCCSLYEQVIKELHAQVAIIKKSAKHGQKARLSFDLLKDYNGEKFNDTLLTPTFFDDTTAQVTKAAQNPAPSSASESCVARAEYEWIDPSLLRSREKAGGIKACRTKQKGKRYIASSVQECAVEPAEKCEEDHVVVSESTAAHVANEPDMCQSGQQEAACAASATESVAAWQRSQDDGSSDSLSCIAPYHDGVVQQTCPEYVCIKDLANRMYIYLFSNTSSSRYPHSQLRYTAHVNAWFNDACKALYDQGYLDYHGPRARHYAPTPEHQLNIVQVHRFSRLVDAYIPKNGISYSKPSRKRAGVEDTYIAIPGMMVYIDRMHTRPQKEFCVFVYIIDGMTGVCFHRNVMFRTNQQIISEFMQRGFYDVEFPALGADAYR